MAIFEPYHPRTEVTGDPESSLFPSVTSPLLSTGRTIRETAPYYASDHYASDALSAPPVVANLGDETGDTFRIPLFGQEPPSGAVGPDALHNKGVNWTEPTSGSNVPELQFARPGFYEVDYDPEGKLSKDNGVGYVKAANVFGRQFSRDELMKDSEGRRLVTLMEKRRSGAYRNEGFWSGLTSFRDMSSDRESVFDVGSYRKALADIPFLGWMVDGGFTVGETIDVSNTMKKMQRGEQVTNHEALAVRRYMLQQEMESERGIGYNVGSLVHSSIPFMFEMAASGAMIAGATKAGAAIGSFIAPVVGTGVGAAIGAAIGAAGALVFGGGGRLLGKLGQRGAKKTTQLVTNQAMKQFATRGVDTAFTHAEAISIRGAAAAALGVSEKELAHAAFQTGREKALVRVGREIAQKRGLDVKALSEANLRQIALGAGDQLDKKLLRQYTRHEALASMASDASRVYNPAIDSKLANRFLVNGDVEHVVRSGWIATIEEAALRRVYPQLKDAPTGYWARRKAIAKGMERLSMDDFKVLREGYATGTLSGVLDDAGLKALRKDSPDILAALGSRLDPAKLGESGFARVSASMMETLGGEGIVHHGYARQVLDRMLDNAMKSTKLKYGVGVEHGFFVNNMQRFGQWFADGMLDGMLRWDTSIFGGIGTIARSGTALGGKMHALTEALKVSFVEAPVRGAMQLSMQAPLWPVASMLSGHGAGDFVLKGQLGVQAQALRTGDKDLMDHSRAIAFGSGLVEYISENAGRGFNIFMGGIAKPTVYSLLPERTRDLGSWFARKIEAVYGPERLMKKESQELIAGAVSAKLGRVASQRGISGLPHVTGEDVQRFVATRSAKGIASIEEFLAKTGMKDKQLLRDAVTEQITHNKLEAGILCFTAGWMMDMGYTPQAFARLLQRVGYDGVVSEMAEERYGGFFTGLLGLDERPSSDRWKDRMKTALEGLFPDKNQLITEAIGFAIPAVTHMALGHLYGRLSQGTVSQIRRDSAELNTGMNYVPELVLPVNSPEYAQKVQEWREKRRAKFDARFGTAEANDEAVTAGAEDLLRRINDGTYTPTDMAKQFRRSEDKVNDRGEVVEKGSAAFKDVEETRAALVEAAANVLKASGNSAELLERNLAAMDAENLFGHDGTEAIRNLWRREDANMDDAKRDFMTTGEYADLSKEVPLPTDTGPADVDDVVRRITMAVPVIAQDQSVISDIRKKLSARSDTMDVRVNQYGEDVLGDKCRAAQRIADAGYRLKYQGTDGTKGCWLRKGLARLVRAVDAFTSGDLSLAAANPVQWALADESLDKDLLNTLVSLKERSVKAGLASMLARNREAMEVLTVEERDAVKPLLDEINGHEENIAAYRGKDRAMMQEAIAAKRDAERRLNELLSQYTAKFSEQTLASLDSRIMREAEEAGAESFQRDLKEYMSAFLTAKNVLAVSRSDMTEAALQVVAKRNEQKASAGEARYGYVDSRGNAQLASNFRSPEFAQAHAADIEDAKHEIVQHLVKMASDNAIKVNTNAKFSVAQSTSAVIDYQRAMANGTPKEIMAAIQAMPAFAHMATVHDLTGGQLVTQDDMEAVGRTGDMAELLAMPTDGNLEQGQLARVMKVMGRDFVFASPEENQYAASRFLRQLHILAESAPPVSHKDRNGNDVRVAYAFSRGDDGVRQVTATVFDKDGHEVTTVAGSTVAGVADLLRSLPDPVFTQMRQLVFMKACSFASRDATSMLLTKMTRDEAYEYYRLQGVAMRDMPPYLRKDDTTGEWLYSMEEAGQHMRDEMALASSRKEDDESVKSAKKLVWGIEGSYMGYEAVAEKYLESLGMRRTSLVREESTLLGGGQMWVMRPSSLTVGDRWLITGDYQSSGETEAMLRATLSCSLLNAYRREDFAGLSRDEMRSAFGAVLDSFNRAAERLATELRPLHPELAKRVKDAADSFGSDDGRINFEKLAAIASSVFCFTSERGLGERGNGFLMSPELAAIADEMRADGATLPFLHVLDRALGGTGLLSMKGPQLTEVLRVVQAFSPPGDAIVNSRKTALFGRTGVDYAPKPGIAVPSLRLGEVSIGPKGKTAAAIVQPAAIDTRDQLQFASVDGLLNRIASSVRSFVVEYEGKVDSLGLTPSEFLRMMVRADEGGGDTAGGESRLRVTRARDMAPKARRVGGAFVRADDSPGARPKSTEVIPEVDALRLGRGLDFLVSAMPGLPARDVADIRSGALNELDARRVAATPGVTDAVRLFLQSRGMDRDSIEVVVHQLGNALGTAQAEDVDEPETDFDEVADAVEEGENVESWQDRKKTNDATENKDLIAVGRLLQHVFPGERRNHMAILCRLYTEIARIARDESGVPQDVKDVAKYFNVLRGRDGKAIAAIADAYGWDDPAVTEKRLSNTVAYLSRIGHDELALALNLVRRIGGRDGVRRTKALRNIGYVARLDAESTYVELQDGQVRIGARPAGSAQPGAADSIRCALNHAVVAMSGALATEESAQETLRVWSATLKPYASDGRPVWSRSNADQQKLRGILEADGSAPEAEASNVVRFLQKATLGGAISADAHKAVCDFANALAYRLRKVADAIDELLGAKGNEYCYALRNPDIVREIVRSVEYIFQAKVAEGQDEAAWREHVVKRFSNAYGRLYENTFTTVTPGRDRDGNDTGARYGHVCPLIENLLVNPITAAAHDAAERFSGAEHGATFRDRMLAALYGSDVVVRAERSNFRSQINFMLRDTVTKGGKTVKPTPRSAWTVHSLPGAGFSDAAKIFKWYVASMPRSTVRVSGVSSDATRDTGEVNGLPASPIVAQARLEDHLLDKLPNTVFGQELEGSARDRYFQLGSRFDDGSRLVVATAGVKVDESLADAALVPKYVWQSNLAAYVEDRDTRNMKFQLYHGEKPTTYSIQLPGYLCEALYRDILEGKAYTRNAATQAKDNEGRTLAERLDRTALADIKDADARRAAYDALFSVISSAAGCDEIDSKRTQVLLSQGTPFAGHRDSYSEIVTNADGTKEEVKVSWESVANAKTGEPVVPATRFVIAVSGSDATENKGMYFAHGRLIEAQRGISTNPESVSFKNHLTDWSGASLTKGQSHAIGLGVYEDEDVPSLGVMREAQRAQRREIERILGLEELVLDLPTEEQRNDPEYMEKRKAAVELMERFFKFSSTVHTDMETQKSGPFGSRCGVFTDGEGGEMTLEIGGKAVTLRKQGRGFEATTDNAPEKGQADERKWSPVQGVAWDKYGKDSHAWKLAYVIPAAMQALGLDELSEEDTAEIRTTWVNGKGQKRTCALADAGIFDGLRREKGDRLAFRRNPSGGFHVLFASRNTVGQIMANSDASANASNEHPAATNYVRDLIANQAFLNVLKPEESVAALVTVARAVPQFLFRAFPKLIADRIDADPEFAFRSSEHQYSTYVREQHARKENAIYAKAMRVYPNASHAVLLGSGRSASLDKHGHTAKITEGAGVTAWDRDATRPARVLKSSVVAAYAGLYGEGAAPDRTYSSGLVNVAGDASFRYGWHLDMEGYAEVLAEINVLVTADRQVGNNTYDRYIEVLERTTDADKEEREAIAAVAVALKSIHGMFQADADAAKSYMQNLVGKLFTDYTGKRLADSACDLERVSLADLFINGEFDFAAVDCGSRKRVSATETAEPTVYIGGSFFSGDRRPSGNFEAACGLARAAAPVTRKADGSPGERAMYVLDPVQSAVQGSDTDGDSATLIKMKGVGRTQRAREFVAAVFTRLDAMRRAAKDVRSFRVTRKQAEDAIRELSENPRFKAYFETTYVDTKTGREKTTDLSQKYVEEMGNLLFEAQIGLYRGLQTREQYVGAGETARTGAQLADEADGDLLDVGFAGRDPVGPDAVSGKEIPADDRGTRSLYRETTGRELPVETSYADAFKATVNALTEKAGIPSKMNLLVSEQAAFLTSAAIDASGGRGVGVALQAAVEHMRGYANQDAAIRRMVPALYDKYVDPVTGEIVYDPCRDFTGHLDGIANALFDVVKDLFAPRAGWQKNMLNLLYARLLARANADYEAMGSRAWRDLRFDDAWFFRELVSFVQDLYASPTSIPSLLSKANAGNNHLESEKFGGNEAKTFRGELLAALGKDADTPLRWLAENLHTRQDEYDALLGGRERTYSGPVHAEGLGKIAEAVTSEFVSDFSSWMTEFSRDALASMNGGVIDPASPLGFIVRAYDEDRLPAGIRQAVDRYASRTDKDGNAVGPSAGVQLMLEDLAYVMDRQDFDRDGGEGRAAIAGHALFGSMDGFADRLAAAVAARAAMADLMRLTDTNKAVSLEPVFRAGPEKAKGVEKRISDVADGVDAEDSMYSTQMFVNGYRLTSMMHDTASFSAANFADEIAAGPQEMNRWAQDFRKKGGDGAYKAVVNAYRVQPLRTDSANDVYMYAAACSLLGTRRAKSGPVSANRQMMGPMLHAVEHALRSCIEAEDGDVKRGSDRFDALMTEIYDGFARGQKTQRRLAAARRADESADDALDPFAYGYDELAGADVTDAKESGTSLLGRLVSLAIQNGASAGSKADLFLLNLNVTETNGRIALESKLGPSSARLVREGFQELSSDRSAELMKFGSEGQYSLYPADIASLLRIHLCSHQAFDAVSENDTRVDISDIFTEAELKEMERYGKAAEDSFVGRALMRVPQRSNGQGGAFYDLLRRAPKSGRVPWFVGPLGRACGAFGDDMSVAKVLESLQGAKDLRPVDIMAYTVLGRSSWRDRVDGLLAAESAAAKARRDKGLPDIVNNELSVKSSFADVEFDPTDPATLDQLVPLNSAEFPFTGRSGEEFDTLEDAVNSYAPEYVGWLESLGVSRDEANVARFLAAYTRGRGAKTTKSGQVNPYAFSTLTERVLEDTRATVGDEAFKAWLTQAMEKGGEARLDSATLELVRDAVKAEAEELGVLEKPQEEPRLHVTIGGPGGVVGQRMLRSGLARFLRETDPAKFAELVTNPFENIRFALQTAFGKYDFKRKTGVKVERVQQRIDGVMQDTGVFRVTRFVKARVNGVAKPVSVVTYISCGEYLELDVTNEIHLESMLEAINRGAEKPMTMEQLKSLPEEQRRELVSALGLSVDGRSAKLTTDALLALTGLVQLGGGADYFTLFHEYFHQMLDFFRRTGVCTAEDEETLKKHFSTNGQFNEEAAANAFAQIVTDAVDNAVGGKLMASGMGGDVDKLFRKFHTELQAMLAGAVTFDVDGMPAFMRMVVTGDFSDREMKRVEELTAARRERVENMILSGEMSADLRADYDRPQGTIADGRAQVRLAVDALTAGSGSMQDLASALGALHGSEEDKGANKPVFPAQTRPFGVKNEPEEPGKPNVVEEAKTVPQGTARGAVIVDKSAPRGLRLQCLLEEAMERFGAADALTAEEREAVRLLHDRVGCRAGGVSYDGYDLVIGIASRVLKETCAALGVNYDRWVEEWLRGGLDAEIAKANPKTATNPDGTRINFTESDHRYWSDMPDGSTLVYTSSTTFIHGFGEKFDRDKVSKKVARKHGTRPEDELRKWDEAAERGTLIHTVYEDVLLDHPVRAVPVGEKERVMVLRAQTRAAELKRMGKVLGTEVLVFDPEAKVAGSIDLLMQADDGTYILVDHKTNGKEPTDSYAESVGDKMTGPVAHLYNGKLEGYRLQLNLYRSLLERSGRIPKGAKVKMMINWFNGEQGKLIDVEDRSKEVEAMLAETAKHPELLVPSGGKEDSHEKPVRPGDANIVAELAVRIAHRAVGAKVTVDSSGNLVKAEMYAPEAYGKVTSVVNTALASAAPSAWPLAVSQMGQKAADALEAAARDFDARAEAEARGLPGDGDAERAARQARSAELSEKARDLEARADRLLSIIDALVRGDNVDRLLTADEATAGADLYDSLFRTVTGGAKATLRNDGSMAYEAAGDGCMDLEGKGCQLAADLAAQALGAATVIHRYLEENGIARVVPGAVPELPTRETGSPLVPVEPAASPSRNWEGEPDLTPQMILQSQTSWMASDLQRGFFGVNLRDMMTDSSLQAITEESNRVANQIDFYLGADVMVGGRARVITAETSRLGRGENGLFEVSKEHAHSVRRAAATRGYLLGIVTRKAKETGRAFTLDDVNMVNFAGQAVGAFASGDACLFTGFDVAPDDPGRLLNIGRTGTLSARNAATLTAAGGHYAVNEVVGRTKGRPQASTFGDERPSNLDILLERIATALPSDISGCVRDATTGELTGECRPGLYMSVIDAYAKAIKSTGRGATATDVRDLVVAELSKQGLAMKSDSGKTVLTIPVGMVEDAWRASAVHGKLLEAGRREQLLDLRYLGVTVGSDATRLNRASMNSKFMADSLGGALAGNAAAGLWWEAGSGHHGLVVDQYRSATEHFNGPVEIGEVLQRKLQAFAITAEKDNKVRRPSRKRPLRFCSLVTGEYNGAVVAGLERAFARDEETGALVNVSMSKLLHLMKLAGVSGNRANDVAVKEFLTGVENGLYSRSNSENRTGLDLTAETTLFELDRQIYELECALLAEERMRGTDGGTVLTRPESEGGFGFSRDELVTLNEVLRRTGVKMLTDADTEQKVSGSVNSMNETWMFRRFGKLPSSKTGTERLRSMAESIVHSERFRGCLTQMLTTVGSDGMPNYIVDPTGSATNLAPDPFWGALARFVSHKLGRLVGGRYQYDEYKSGVENMKALAGIVKELIETDRANVKDKGAKPTMRWHAVPPQNLGANRLFDGIYVLDDLEQDDAHMLNKMVGGEAEGYLKQLFSVVSSPSVWQGAKWVDRMMSYSKAMSVGMSAFFAFATRFESPVAACGFLNTVPGYFQWSANLARKLADTGFGKAFSKTLQHMGLEGLDGKMPMLADFMATIASDDPMTRDMRELCDLVQIPLSDAIRNPMNDAGGYIESDIKRIKRMLELSGHHKWAREVTGILNAALKNPGEYAFSNILNCVQMAVVAQTMYRLRRECELGNRPFDPVRELRRVSSYLSTEVGGITPERYAWLTPGMQRVLRMSMFSWMWTMSAWTAGCGEMITDALFGGHNTNAATRRFAFVRWMRMLGVVKVGVPLFLQATIRGLAAIIQRMGIVGDPDDPEDKDPLGIEKMPWLCFDNESQIGALSFDVTPLLKLAGRLRKGFGDIVPEGVTNAIPAISAFSGAVLGGALTRSYGGGVIGAAMGAAMPGALPNYEGVGRGRNTSGRRRYYMHFGKQSDEFWRWFTEPWKQATSKLSIPTQKAVEAFFGSTDGSSFSKPFAEKDLLDRFITGGIDPSQNAIVNFFTAFTPFSFASFANHPDAGAMAMFGPVQMGTSMTGAQKRIAARIRRFAEDDRLPDPWASPKNKKELRLLCSDILREADLNGMDPAEALKSGLGTVSKQIYIELFSALPKTKNDVIDGAKATKCLRALFRINRKYQDIEASLRDKYKAANLDWKSQKNRALRVAVKRFLRQTGRNPWIDDEESEELFDQTFEAYDPKTIRQAGKGGEALSNFLATDKVPETLFGIPVVSQDYTEEDIEFFKRNPKAGGFYDFGGESEEPPEELPPEEPLAETVDVDEGRRIVQQASGGGDAEEFMNRNPSLFSHVKSFEKMEAKPYEDLGGYAIGYGAHIDKDGRPVTADTAAVDEATATAMLARDLLVRRDRLARVLPGWKFMPGAAKQALLDVSMGRNDILSKEGSPGLHDDLVAAGRNRDKLLAAVKKHYYSYRTSKNPDDQAGLEARRVAGGRLFFGEDFSYDGKTWDPKLGFIIKGDK